MGVVHAQVLEMNGSVAATGEEFAYRMHAFSAGN
jgi:hypothetical protein